MIALYSAPTPNGWKISIALEELGLPYTLHALDLGMGEQKRPEYVALNPNGRIPTIVDSGNQDMVVFESGAILWYLAEKTGRLLPSDPRARSVVMQWLFFQVGGIGPMQGQASLFLRIFPEKLQSVIDRYTRETLRLYGVLDTRLAQHEFIGGAELSIADIATWPWVHTYAWCGVDLDGTPNLRRWYDALSTRPAFAKGVRIPEPLNRDVLLNTVTSTLV